jgi:hypothetical protein
MYSVQKLLSSPTSKKFRKVALLNVAIVLFLSFILSLATPIWSSIGLWQASKSPVKAAAPQVRRINIPYFNNSTVPFNQTSVFWFGGVSSSSNYVDVRMGYNNSELYVNLQIVDLYLWYDSNAKSPNLAIGDTATLYLNTTQNGSNAPDQISYKFVAQVNWFQPRTYYQKAYRGNGSNWVASSVPFSAVSGWRGTGFNGRIDSGWTMTYHIPFSSLGKSVPSQGTAWKLGVKVQNQDSASTTNLPLTWWPETANDTISANWGALVFGLPTYQAPRTSNNATYTVRNGLNNQVVTDGMVGGSLGCFNSGANRWTQFGGQSYPGATRINIQNEWDISDWNCFSKFYISFPLGSLPTGKGVVSAKVTLNEYGHAGGAGNNPSLIQVAAVGQSWNPATLSWNNAPLMQENISRTVVNTVSKSTFGQSFSWDVSKALAAAYAAGQPLRLVFYSSDSAYSTGKYFFSSTVGDWNASGRPTLQATLGTVTGSSSSSGNASTTTSVTTAASASRGQQVEVGAQFIAPTKKAVISGKENSHTSYFAPLFVLPAPLFFLGSLLRRKRGLRQR